MDYFRVFPIIIFQQQLNYLKKKNTLILKILIYFGQLFFFKVKLKLKKNVINGRVKKKLSFIILHFFNFKQTNLNLEKALLKNLHNLNYKFFFVKRLDVSCFAKLNQLNIKLKSTFYLN